MANKVEIQIIGNNVMAVNAIDGVKTKLGTLEKTSRTTADRMLGHFKMIGGAFLAGGAFSFMRSSIEAFKEQEIAIRKLDTALEGTTFGLQSYAAGLQKVTTFGDEVTLDAMARIAVFVKEEDRIKALTKASMDFATVKAIDLSSAADLMTKTFASSINALSRYGLTVEGAAGSTERFNSLIQAMTKYQGQAEAQGKTLTGQMEILNNQLNDQQEDIGGALLPIWVYFNKVIADTIKSFQNLSGLTYGKMLAEQERQLTEMVGKRTDQMFEILGVNKSIVLGTFEKVKAEEKITEENKKQVDLVKEAALAEMRKNQIEFGAQKMPDFSGLPIFRFYDAQIEKIQEVTDFELAALFLRSEAAYSTFGDMAGAMMNFYQMAGQESRTFFDMYKVFAAGEAAIAAYDAATKVFAATAFMYPFNYVAAGAALAFGLSNVGRILSMQPGGSGGGGGGATPSMPGGGNTTNNNNQRSNNYVITINTQGGFEGDKDKFAREIIYYIDKARGDGG